MVLDLLLKNHGWGAWSKSLVPVLIFNYLKSKYVLCPKIHIYIYIYICLFIYLFLYLFFVFVWGGIFLYMGPQGLHGPGTDGPRPMGLKDPPWGYISGPLGPIKSSWGHPEDKIFTDFQVRGSILTNFHGFSRFLSIFGV